MLRLDKLKEFQLVCNHDGLKIGIRENVILGKIALSRHIKNRQNLKMKCYG